MTDVERRLIITKVREASKKSLRSNGGAMPGIFFQALEDIAVTGAEVAISEMEHKVQSVEEKAHELAVFALAAVEELDYVHRTGRGSYEVGKLLAKANIALRKYYGEDGKVSRDTNSSATLGYDDDKEEI